MKVCVLDTSKNAPALHGLAGLNVCNITPECLSTLGSRAIFQDADLVLIHTSEALSNDAITAAKNHAPNGCLRVHYTDNHSLGHFHQDGNVIECSHTAVVRRIDKMVEKALDSESPFAPSILRFDFVKIISCVIHELYVRSLAFKIEMAARPISKAPASCTALSVARASSMWQHVEAKTFYDFIRIVLQEDIPGEDTRLENVAASFTPVRDVEWPNSFGSSKKATEQLEELAEILKKEDAGACEKLNDWIDRFDKYLRELRIELQK